MKDCKFKFFKAASIKNEVLAASENNYHSQSKTTRTQTYKPSHLIVSSKVNNIWSWLPCPELARAPGTEFRGVRTRCSKAYGIHALHFAILETAKNQPQESSEMGKIQLPVLQVKEWRVPIMFCLPLFTFLLRSEVWANISPTHSSLSHRSAVTSVPLCTRFPATASMTQARELSAVQLFKKHLK